MTKRRRQGQPILNIYDIDIEALNKLNVRRFDSADEEWLDFVVTNRMELISDMEYDAVIGPVANDSTLPVINDYMDGVYTKVQAVERLMPQNLTDQYALLTADALKLLHFEGSEEL